MDELIAFLTRCLDEDERKVAAMEREEARVRTAPIFQGHPPNWLAGVDIFVSSKRWRAEVEAKRSRIGLLDLLLGTSEPGEDAADIASTLMHIEARPYAGQDGWREEWQLSDGS
jgi:hypothetical protein